MTTLKDSFISWFFNELQQDFPAFNAMKNTFEDSPWHREKSVAIHTNMVVAHFIGTITTKNWDRDDVSRAIALAFHDVGKPAAKTEHFSEERGNFYRFVGHELISARMWEDYAVANWQRLVELFGLTPHHIYKIGWMIEYHKPWDIKKPNKLKKIALTIDELTWADSFGSVIMADTLGRIQDDRQTSITTAADWCTNMIDMVDNLPKPHNEYDSTKPTLTMLIGPSGAGKSTWVKNNAPSTDIYSLDILRHDWYDPDDYSNAFKLSCEDKFFKNKASAEFMWMIKSGGDLVVDNTNISNKRRNFYITEARKHGYHIRAVLFPISCSQAVIRQSNRPDKNVPMDAVVGQYMKLQYPLYGDYDEVIVYDGNLP